MSVVKRNKIKVAVNGINHDYWIDPGWSVDRLKSNREFREDFGLPETSELIVSAASGGAPLDGGHILKDSEQVYVSLKPPITLASVHKMVQELKEKLIVPPNALSTPVLTNPPLNAIPMGRFWVFAGPSYYPGGGLEDFRGATDSLEEAMTYFRDETRPTGLRDLDGKDVHSYALSTHEFDWGHVLDMVERKIVHEFGA